jgi:[ribosomal protein S18]-alanine N-acetyltransferase
MRPSSLGYRHMRRQDLPAVMAIERAAYAYCWSQGNFRDCLDAAYEMVVCELECRIVGYGVMSVAADEAHILNLCIAPCWQSSGHGRRLLEYLLSIAEQQHASTIFLEVRASNHRARARYHSAGFNEIGFRSGYYPADNGREDAIVFARSSAFR